MYRRASEPGIAYCASVNAASNDVSCAARWVASVSSACREFRNCTAPSTERILEILSTVTRHQLHHDGVLVKTFHPELTAQQVQVLELMELTPSVYTQLT
jgi:hypothetical protein